MIPLPSKKLKNSSLVISPNFINWLNMKFGANKTFDLFAFIFLKYQIQIWFIMQI